MATLTKFVDGRFGHAAFGLNHAGLGLARIERAAEMFRMEGGCFNGFLQVHAVMNVMQEHNQRPLVLLISARCTKRHIRLAITHGY